MIDENNIVRFCLVYYCLLLFSLLLFYKWGNTTHLEIDHDNDKNYVT